MAKIRTTVAVSYDNRNPLKQAKIVLSLEEWIERNGVYTAKVVDYIETDTGGLAFYRDRIVPISEGQFNGLIAAIESDVPSELTPYQKRELRKSLSLLLYVQTDILDDGIHTIYNLLPEEWELLPESWDIIS